MYTLVSSNKYKIEINMYVYDITTIIMNHLKCIRRKITMICQIDQKCRLKTEKTLPTFSKVDIQVMCLD